MSVRLSLSVYVTFVAFSDCESCTRSISTSPGSMEAGEYGRTRGCVSSHAVSSWTRSPSCCGIRDVFWVGRFFFFFRVFLSIFFFFELTQPAASMRPPCLIYLSTSTRVRTGCHYLISLVCICVTLNSSFLLITRAVRGQFPQTQYL